MPEATTLQLERVDAVQWVRLDHLEDVLRPGIESVAASRTKLEEPAAMNAEGVASGPVTSAELGLDETALSRLRADGIVG